MACLNQMLEKPEGPGLLQHGPDSQLCEDCPGWGGDLGQLPDRALPTLGV